MGKIAERNHDSTTAETWGSVTIAPLDDVIVGTFSTWTLTYTVGAYAMDVGGGLKIGTRRQADFGEPQFEKPRDDNYTTVACSRPGSRFGAFYDKRGHKRPFNAVIVLRLLEGPLYPGDTVSVVLGDASGGSRGLLVQSFPESACDFAVFVDPISSGEYKRVFCRSGTFRVLSGPSEHLSVTAPTVVRSGEAFRVQVRGNDRFGNPTPVDAHGLVLESDVPAAVDVSKHDGRAKWIDGVTLNGTGVRRLDLRSGNSVLATSNPIVVEDGKNGLLCWGDTQAQTASTVGIGTPDEYFTYARDLAAIDFTTHQGNDFILSDKDLDDVRLAAREHHEPGRFVTFFGWEWSGPTGTGGDRNVLFLDDSGPIFRSSHWQLEADEISKTTVANECVHARHLQNRMRRYMEETGRKVIMIPHIGGRRSDYTFQDPELEPVFEICSNHGIFEWRLHEFLRNGIKVGVIGASDDHTCRPGLAYPSTPEMTIVGGLTAVYAESLTRDSIYQALMARRCYATTGPRVFLAVEADGHPMGQSFETSQPPRISATVHGTASIESISLFNRSKELERYTPNPKRRDGRRLRLTWTGANSPDRGRFMHWDGKLTLNGGRLLNVTPLNMVAVKSGVESWNNQSAAWRSVTSGQEEGLLLELDANDDATIGFATGPADIQFRLADVRKKDLHWELGGLEQSVRATTLHTVGDVADAELVFTDNAAEPGEQAYWVRVIQTDFHRAWSSPIYVRILGSQ